MSIRAAGPDDVDRLLALEEDAFGREAWSHRLVREALPYALVGDGPDLGWAVLSVAGEVADLQRIAAGVRRTGTGTRLLAAALGSARDAGAERVLLEVREDNEAGRAFYAAAGFVEIDRRRGYYRDGVDALVLELVLAAG
ncbi:GNAT family N-acetyltransferase [Nocardioides mangrovicus]|uniref:GNAT family N-acetyltransferase n=1 Tax=Nocardioides mangrovicus TaxID=2478913 RepID=A0A3L8P6Z1_9ACTN|nr:GNAT family N-acetyltransferase [Nocardioides mangrovicus]RLV50692.1 GNAT family N-acetyltransferase [Nocardioides mangrovicus]